jgi:hypothetical protein
MHGGGHVSHGRVGGGHIPGGQGRLRRSDTPMSLYVARVAVLLAAIGVLMWIGLR